ncbi:hypothetical protein BDM02DRAFT_3112885 [Thelephora ganbajun]|uniref:Uncharacterized protein n=1 Tax=Thelephora ganbajun TaxID=370292 RepID=A0ACB6ZKH7_THEGA|nr:hypothetical protein BDM02DRAFT_3112885 [Thelephora ganbajun]
MEATNVAEKRAGIAPVKAAFGSVSALLATIRVRFLPSYDDVLPVHIYIGLDDQKSGLCGTRASVRRRLRSP